MSSVEVLLQQILIGLSNGMIIALIALGYTMVYGIIELINFAHGDLFMIGSFFALTLIGALLGPAEAAGVPKEIVLSGALIITPLFCGTLNILIDRFAYKPVRKSSKLAPLVCAIGVSFILLNIGLFWGGLPLKVFGGGKAASSPKDFPSLVSSDNLFGETSTIYFSMRELLVFIICIPLLILFTIFIKRSKTGKAMRAVAQNPSAALLMGIDVDRIISFTFFIGGLLAGAASVVYGTYNGTIHFQMGFRIGMDAFTAAVLGGIGSLPGALLGGLLIGILRAASDQYLSAEWTGTVVFSILILVLMFRPTGILGSRAREKV